MTALRPQEAEFSDAWLEGDDSARWRSAGGLGPSAGASESGSSLLEVPAGCALPRHTDSAEEHVVVIAGTAEVELDGETDSVPAGGVALVPKGVPHQVRNAGGSLLRFVAVYADVEVVTRYEHEVQPSGERESQTVG